MSEILNRISEATLLDFISLLIDAKYYEVFFPFLLLFALYYHVLYLVISKKNNSVLFSKSSAILISIIISFYSISYTFSSGYTIADLMIMLFPNISSITIAILSMYIIGSVLGVDFFKNMFRKDINAYSIFFFGAVALGSVIYYGGIVLGLWNFDPYDQTSWFSIVLSVGLLILGIVFIIIGWFATAIVCFYVAGSFIYNLGEVSIFDLIFDPILFILFIITAFISWMSTGERDLKFQLKENLQLNSSTIEDIEKRYGRKPNPGEDLLYDINSQAYEGNLNRWNSNFQGEDWK